MACLPAWLAAADSVRVHVKVLDATTRQELVGVRITAMTLDSTVVGTAVSFVHQSPMVVYAKPFVISSVLVPGAGQYLLSLEKEGYGPAYRRVDVPRRSRGSRVTSWRADDVYLLPEAIELGEATVTASKILMVVRGDTLVYNADALQLAAGSMLERLVEQLPGVRIDGQGRITVYGRKVERLLLNGKDFFSGDPLVALENLPAYMVDKVKVYQPEAPDAYLLPDEGLLPRSSGGLRDGGYVMDVQLKREYSAGWIGNAEGAYGTSGRYLARVLALRFSDRSRVTAYANLNNTNDTRRPGRDGGWVPAWTASGRTSMKSGGLDFLLTDPGPRKLGSLSSTLTARHEDVDSRSETASTQFLTSGDVYGRLRGSSRPCKTSLDWDNKFELRARKAYATLSPSVGYVRSEGRSLSQAADFLSDPLEAYRMESLDSLFAPAGSRRLDSLLVNRREEASSSLSEEWTLDGKARVSFPHFFVFEPKSLDLWGRYVTRRQEGFSRYDARYGQGGASPDFRNRYEERPASSHAFGASVSVGTPSIDARRLSYSVGFDYSYEQGYASDARTLYRLDSLGGVWATADGTATGSLPSTRDSMALAVDRANTYHTPTRSYVHTPVLTVSLGDVSSKGWGSLKFKLHARYRHDRLLDRRDGRQAELSRRFHSWEPEVYYTVGLLWIDYAFSRTAPPLSNLLDIVDDANPLAVWKGNPGLKPASRHAVSFRVGSRAGARLGRNLWAVNGEYNLYRSSVGQSATYDMSTGVTTYQPRNIDGNWDATLGGSYTTSPDSLQRFFVETTTRATFRHSVDFATARGSGADARSSVDNLSLGQSVSASYRRDGFSLTAKARADWTYATSGRAGFSTISSVDFQYGLSASLRLPWDLEVGTDLTMYSRRGYDDASMNTDDLVWNLRVSKSMLPRRNLTVLVDGFDVLGQLSNVRRVLNAQGRTETWYNTLPRYAMVHLVYRLNFEPKKPAAR